MTERPTELACARITPKLLTERTALTIIRSPFHLAESMSMTITLTPELERLVQEEVATGMYESASEVIRDALRRFFTADEWAAMDEEVLPRLEAVEAGTAETVSFDEFKASGFAYIDNV